MCLEEPTVYFLHRPTICSSVQSSISHPTSSSWFQPLQQLPEAANVLSKLLAIGHVVTVRVQAQAQALLSLTQALPQPLPAKPQLLSLFHHYLHTCRRGAAPHCLRNTLDMLIGSSPHRPHLSSRALFWGRCRNITKCELGQRVLKYIITWCQIKGICTIDTFLSCQHIISI